MKHFSPTYGGFRNRMKLRTASELRQVIKSSTKLGTFILQPGQKVYEMICVPLRDGHVVKGLDLVTGEFDPEIAEIREAVFLKAASMGKATVKDLGEVKAGVRCKWHIIDGNIYEVAINIANARKKIIKKYFPPLK